MGITDEEVLDQAEQEFSDLAAEGIGLCTSPYDLAYLQSLHQQLFGDVYEWAGELRSIDISKESTRFCNAGRIAPEGRKLFKKLQDENWLEGLSDENFINRLAEYYVEINMLHPFREGNGRAQRLLFEHIAANTGRNLMLVDISRADWIDANKAGALHCNYGPMEAIFKRCISDLELDDSE